MHIPEVLENDDARQRAEDAARHFELAVAMQPQVRAWNICAEVGPGILAICVCSVQHCGVDDLS